MTEPAPTQAQIDEHTEQAAQLEEQAAGAAAAVLSLTIAAMLAELTAFWFQLFAAGVTPELLPQFRDRLFDRLDGLPTGPGTDLVGWVEQAARLGGTQAAAEAGLVRNGADFRPHPDTLEQVRQVPARITEAYDHARRLADANGLVDYDAVVEVVAAARGAVVTTERTARWAVNAAVADGATDLCEQEDVPRVWVPERNACLHCLAYAGRIAKPGQDFPAGLTFADRPLDMEPVRNPPRHPNCRCRVSPWMGSGDGVGPAQFPAVLVREAERSVLRGSSEHASLPARLRAADRLLKRGTGLPKTVQQRAAAAIARGAFE